MLFQAQKRKLGLLESDDVSNLDDIEQNFGKKKGNDDISRIGKNRGMFIIFFCPT